SPLWPRRHVEARPARRPGKAAIEPGKDRGEAVDADKRACLVEIAQRPHPRKDGDIGNGVVVAHHPLAAGEPALEHAEKAPGLAGIAVARALVLDLAAGEFVEETELPEHRPYGRHLEEHPLDGLVAARGVGGG